MGTEKVLAKAKLCELDNSSNQEIKSVEVQFNPETLKVSFANQVKPPEGNAGSETESASVQYVGSGSSKLALQLWFDVTALPQSQRSITDVRILTQEVAYFITPGEVSTTVKGKTVKSYVPPRTRFKWGSFQFDGIVDALEESLEFFSAEGKPQRAQISLSMTQQRITRFAPNRPPMGAAPLTLASAGATLQSIASQAGQGQDWQQIAAANNIENPRMLEPGQLLNMNASASGSSAGMGWQ